MPIQHPTDDDHIFTEYTIGPYTIETYGDVDAVWEHLCEKHGYSEVVDQNELMLELPWCKGVMKPDERHPRPPFDPHPQDLDFSAPHGLVSPGQDDIEWVENYQSKAEYPSMLFAGMTYYGFGARSCKSDGSWTVGQIKVMLSEIFKGLENPGEDDPEQFDIIVGNRTRANHERIRDIFPRIHDEGLHCQMSIFPRFKTKRGYWMTTLHNAHRFDPQDITVELEKIKAKELEIEQMESPLPQTAVLFPGQGTQTVGMGKLLVEGPHGDAAREVYAKASKVLGYDLLDICLNGPKEKLDQTMYSQPAVVVTSLAAMAVHEKDNEFHACKVAGFSLGEYAALIYSGAITFDDGLNLIKIRGEAMDKAAKETNGGMVSVIGLPDSKIEELITMAKAETDGIADEPIQIANHLFPDGRTLSGHKDLCKWFVDNAKDHGAKNAKMLPVAGAFHSGYMDAAKETLAAAVAGTKISFPENCEIYSNVTAQAYKNAEDIKKNLPMQLVSSVHWQQTMELFASSDLEAYIEPGPGQQLKAMLKRVDADQAGKLTNIKVN
jgi:[acyl-carrier-protein] S-malonyltransferase